MNESTKQIIRLLDKHGIKFKFDDYLYLEDILSRSFIRDISNGKFRVIRPDFRSIRSMNLSLHIIKNDLHRHKIIFITEKDLYNTSMTQRLISELKNIPFSIIVQS